MRTLKTWLMASVAVATFGIAEQANAQTFIYGGGAGAIQRNIGCSIEDAGRCRARSRMSR